MRISVLIPCHNAARWLSDTLESALALDWPDVEIIVVDDGSTDESAAIATSFARRSVILVRQENRGASAARNRAFEVSTGDFIQFLDADDLLAPDKVRLQMECLSHAPKGSIASGAWGRFKEDPSVAHFSPSSLQEDMTGVEYLTRYCDTGDMMQPSAWLTPRCLIERIGRWDESLSLNDDGEFFARAVLAAGFVIYCQGARCFYRSGINASLSQRTDIRSLRSLYRSVERTIGYLLHTCDTHRCRTAAANAWNRLAWEIYPGLPRETRHALRQTRLLGGATRSMPMPGKVRLLSRFIGWRLARRLQVTLRR